MPRPRPRHNALEHVAVVRHVHVQDLLRTSAPVIADLHIQNLNPKHVHDLLCTSVSVIADPVSAVSLTLMPLCPTYC